jgi:putative DNA primase/helicase
MHLSTPNGLFISNANIRLINPKRYLYHAYLSFMESRDISAR